MSLIDLIPPPLPTFTLLCSKSFDAWGTEPELASLFESRYGGNGDLPVYLLDLAGPLDSMLRAFVHWPSGPDETDGFVSSVGAIPRVEMLRNLWRLGMGALGPDWLARSFLNGYLDLLSLMTKAVPIVIPNITNEDELAFLGREVIGTHKHIILMDRRAPFPAVGAEMVEDNSLATWLTALESRPDGA